MRRVALTLALMLGAVWAPGAALPAPTGLTAVTGTASPLLDWKPVPGATLYRVAVFADAGGAQGAPVAAVWVPRGPYKYGVGAVLAPKGALGNKAPEPLRPGLRYRWMVAAAREGGAEKSAWTGAALEPFTVVAPPAADAATDTRAALVAKPEPGTEVAAPLPSPQQDAAALLKAKQWDKAQAAFLALTQKEPNNAAAWKGLGDAYAGGLMKLEAMESYRKSLDLNPKDEELKAWLQKNYRAR